VGCPLAERREVDWTSLRVESCVCPEARGGGGGGMDLVSRRKILYYISTEGSNC